MLCKAGLGIEPTPSEVGRNLIERVADHVDDLQIAVSTSIDQPVEDFVLWFLCICKQSGRRLGQPAVIHCQRSCHESQDTYVLTYLLIADQLCMIRNIIMLGYHIIEGVII